MFEIRICHLYPDLLNLYGDRGNILALTRRCLWRGIRPIVTNVSLGDGFDSEKYDIIFLGGGQDYEQEIIASDFLKQKGPEILRAVAADKVFLCICGGYQLMGKYYKTWDGHEIEFLGALNLWTLGAAQRIIGNLVFEVDFLKSSDFGGQIVGFENHSGRTYLGEGVLPLGKVIKGGGNNGQDGWEGAVYKNVYCSYSHGSLLPKNPALTDHLLTLALQRYKDFSSLQMLDDSLENQARENLINKYR